MILHPFRLLLLCFLAAPTSALALTTEEVACEEAKLERLIHRMSTNGPGINLFVWSVGGERYSGLAALPFFVPGEEGLAREEWQLGFELLLERKSDFLNPRREFFAQAVLARNNLLTTPFQPPTEDPRIDVSLDLTPEAIDPTRPTSGILINSQTGTPTGSASGAGRALEAENLFVRCSAEEPSAFDLQAFEILSRTLRISEDLLLPLPGRGLFRYKAILFRDVEPQVYRVKVFLYYTICDPECGYSEADFQLRVRMPQDADGRLVAGNIEALPWCHAGAPPPCTGLINPDSAVIVAPPIFAGHEIQTEAQFRSGAFLNIPVEDSPDNILVDDVPWPELLRGTAWDRPRAPAP